MRINLIYGEGEPKTGYLNLSPFCKQEDEYNKKCELDNLHYLCDGEATEILAIDVVDYLSLTEVNSYIDHWVSKLRIGGKLIISGVDGFSVAKAFSSYQISIDEYNGLIHGSQTSPHLVRRTSLTLTGLEQYLVETHSLTLVHKRYDGFAFMIEVERKNDE